MTIIPQSTSIRLPVRLIDSTGASVTGILPADINDGTGATKVNVVKSNGTLALITLTNGVNWFEISAGKAPGLYHVLVPNTATNLIGPLQLSVLPNVPGTFLPFIGTSQVEILNLAAKITKNRWKIQTAGPDINRLVIFDDDGTTTLVKFDLKDNTGAPTSSQPFERIPV